MPTEEGPQSLSWSGLFLQPKAPPISSVTQMLFGLHAFAHAISPA